jgi:hypothetical protein
MGAGDCDIMGTGAADICIGCKAGFAKDEVEILTIMVSLSLCTMMK